MLVDSSSTRQNIRESARLGSRRDDRAGCQLPNYQIYLKIMIDSTPPKSFQHRNHARSAVIAAALALLSPTSVWPLKRAETPTATLRQFTVEAISLTFGRFVNLNAVPQMSEQSEIKLTSVAVFI